MSKKKDSALYDSVELVPQLVVLLNDCLPKGSPNGTAENRINILMVRMSAIQSLLAYHVNWFEEQTGEDITESVIEMLRGNVKELRQENSNAKRMVKPQ